MSRVVQVSGPPCGGKSARLRVLAGQGFVTLDEWEFLRDAGARQRDRVPEEAWSEWWAVVDRAIVLHAEPGAPDLAFIAGRPLRRSRLVSEVEVVNPGKVECVRRAMADGRPDATLRWIDRWFDQWGNLVVGAA